MKTIKSKVLFFGVGLFAFTAIHAQETPKKDTTEPKKDTTVMVNLNKVNHESTAILTESKADTTEPKKDTTSMVNLNKVNHESSAMVTTSKTDTTQPKKDTTVMVNLNKVNRESTSIVATSFVMINDNKAAAKLEAIDNKKLI